MTPVYYLESGQVKFWQTSSSTSSATVITPNAIVAKKQSQASISYDPYNKQTIVAVYKGEAEVADIATGKKMLVKPTDEGKPRIAIISFTSATSSSKPVVSSAPIQLSSGLTSGMLIIVGFLAVILGYVIIRKRSYIGEYYSRIKTKLFIKNKKNHTV